MTLEPPTRQTEPPLRSVTSGQPETLPAPKGLPLLSRKDLEAADFFRVVGLQYETAKAIARQRWGSRRANLNHCMFRALQRLLRHGDFALGRRVAYKVTDFAELLDCRPRNVSVVLGKFAEFPELIRVVRVKQGEPGWNGRRSAVDHNEFVIGAALLATAEEVLGRPLFIRTPETVTLTTCNGDTQPPATVTPDSASDPSIDSKLKLKELDHPAPGIDRLNFEVVALGVPSPLSLATEIQPPTATPTAEVIPERATKDPTPPVTVPCSEPPPSSVVRPSIVQARPRPHAPLPSTSESVLSHPLPLLDAVIRQHRAIAEAKGPYVPISQDERRWVDGCLRRLTGCRSDQEKLERCARVSELAARDSRQKGHKSAALRYAFGGLEDNPQKYFLERVALLREHDEKCSKEFHDAELTSMLLGTPPPVKAAPLRPVRPSARGRTPRAAPGSCPMSPAEILAGIQAFQARMSQPLERAG